MNNSSVNFKALLIFNLKLDYLKIYDIKIRKD